MSATAELELGMEQEAQSANWQRADIAYPEIVAEARARTSAFIGSLVTGGEVEVEGVHERVNSTTLLAAVQMAAVGDVDARNLVLTSVRTDLSERMYKSKNETVVRFQVSGGQLRQHGRLNIEVLSNVFRYSELNPTMYGMALYEHGNANAFDMFLQNGVLDTHDILVASATTTDEETRKKYNLFEETDTMSLQLLSKNASEAELQTAFVAGKTSKGGSRHDMAAIRQVAKRNGVELREMPAEELVQYILLIPKGNLPNGVTTIVEQYDDAAGGTFYGEAEPRQDYAQFSKMCRARNFVTMAHEITGQLIKEAHTFKNPMDPTARLNKLSGAAAVAHAVKNQDIDERIFGPTAAGYIEHARAAIQKGDYSLAKDFIEQAVATEISISCPLSNSDLARMYGSDEYGSLAFECPDGHMNVRNPGQLKETCDFCKISVRC